MKKLLLIISGIMLFGGMLFFAYLNEWIIIINPLCSNEKQQTQHLVQKKIIQLYFWQKNQWSKESRELIVGSDAANTIYYVVKYLLELLDQEGCISKKVSVQSVAWLGPGIVAYISFDRNPFDKQSSCFEKWMWVEGLLKTLKALNMHISSAQFLVHGEPLNDYHLDFSKPWPVHGFNKNVDC